jgi:hypothetical protein
VRVKALFRSVYNAGQNKPIALMLTFRLLSAFRVSEAKGKGRGASAARLAAARGAAVESASVVQTLMKHDRVDALWLKIFR